MPDSGLGRIAELGLGLVVAVQVDAGGVEARPEGHVELAARGHVHRQGQLGAEPVDRRERCRLARVQDLEVLGPGPEGVEVRARPGADVILGVDVDRGPELGHHLDHVAAPHLQVPARVDAAPCGVHRRALDVGLLAGGAHGRVIVTGGDQRQRRSLRPGASLPQSPPQAGRLRARSRAAAA